MSAEDEALGDAIAQLNATNPFHTSDEAEDPRASGRCDSGSDSGSEEEVMTTAQALQDLVLHEEAKTSAAAPRPSADTEAEADPLLDALASTRESDEARMMRYAELRNARARLVAERDDLVASAAQTRTRTRSVSASTRMTKTKTAPKRDSFDDYLDEITTSGKKTRPRVRPRPVQRSGARASAQQDLQGEQKRMNIVAEAMLFSQ